MLLQVLQDIFFFLFKVGIWILTFVVIPLGIFILSLILFPDFSHDADLWFWVVFGLLNIIAYYVLWKPILWVIGRLSFLFRGA